MPKPRPRHKLAAHTQLVFLCHCFTHQPDACTTKPKAPGKRAASGCLCTRCKPPSSSRSPMAAPCRPARHTSCRVCTGSLAMPGGYIPASAQEAILQSFLGHQQASCKASTSCASTRGALHLRRRRIRALRMRVPAQAALAPGARAASLLSLQPQAPRHPLPTKMRCQLLPLWRATLSDYGADSCGTPSPASMLTMPLPCCASLATCSGHVKGPLRHAMQFALTYIVQASAQSREAERAWKLWLLLPRMLLRRAGAQRLPKSELRERYDRFSHGDWAALLATPLAAGDAATLGALRDPARRPPEPYAPLDPSILQWSPQGLLTLTRATVISNLRRSRRGAVPGPSGYTADILRPLLDDAAGIEALHGVAELLARAELPAPASSALALLRIIALSKCSGHRRRRLSQEVGRAHSGAAICSRFRGCRTPAPVPAQKHSCIPCKSLATVTPRSLCSLSMGSVLLI